MVVQIKRNVYENLLNFNEGRIVLRTISVLVDNIDKKN